jgi:hypothetical protein
VNISAVDYGPFDELEILKRFGARYKPDLVLHGLYIGNDLGVPDRNVMTYLGIGVRTPQGYVAYRPRNFLSVQWLRSFFSVKIDTIRREMEANADPSGIRGILSETGFLNVERKYLKTFSIDPSPDLRWVGTVKNLDDIRNEVSQMGALYILVIHPDQIQFDSDLRYTLEQRFSLSLDQGYDFKLPQQFLSKYCLSRDIHCLDLLPTFDTLEPEDLYKPNDIHYSQAGNKATALLILEYLRTEQIFPD